MKFPFLFSSKMPSCSSHYDVLMSADSGYNTILILLNLSAAFDTVDHFLLLKQLLSNWVGVGGPALEWFNYVYQTEYLRSLMSTFAI